MGQWLHARLAEARKSIIGGEIDIGDEVQASQAEFGSALSEASFLMNARGTEPFAKQVTHAPP